MENNRIQDASQDLVNSVRDTNQTLINNMVTLQNHYVKFAHDVLLNWTQLLESQTETTQNVIREWGQQIQQQQEAFQRLAPATTQAYLNFLLAPFTFYQELAQAGRMAMDRELQLTKKAA
jgi:gas vesicle protein